MLETVEEFKGYQDDDDEAQIQENKADEQEKPIEKVEAYKSSMLPIDREL